jgi:hypothetical protein
MWDVTKNKQGDGKKNVFDPNFKGFMASIVHVNWNTVCIVYDFDDPNELWLIKIVLLTFIGLHPWINTQNNKPNQSYVNNTRHYAMNTIMPHHWKRLMFSMWAFIVGGVL